MDLSEKIKNLNLNKPEIDIVKNKIKNFCELLKNKIWGEESSDCGFFLEPIYRTSIGMEFRIIAFINNCFEFFFKIYIHKEGFPVKIMYGELIECKDENELEQSLIKLLDNENFILTLISFKEKKR